MRQPKKTRRFKITMPDNQPLKVKYVARWSELKEYNHRVDHFEFYGGLTNTGYRCHFVQVEPDYNPTKKELFDYMRRVIEEVSGLKYNKPAQTKLF